MILIDEKQLSNGTIAMIGEDLDLYYDINNYNPTTYQEHLDSIVEQLFVDIEE